MGGKYKKHSMIPIHDKELEIFLHCCKPGLLKIIVEAMVEKMKNINPGYDSQLAKVKVFYQTGGKRKICHRVNYIRGKLYREKLVIPAELKELAEEKRKNLYRRTTFLKLPTPVFIRLPLDRLSDERIFIQDQETKEFIPLPFIYSTQDDEEEEEQGQEQGQEQEQEQGPEEYQELQFQFDDYDDEPEENKKKPLLLEACKEKKR